MNKKNKTIIQILIILAVFVSFLICIFFISKKDKIYTKDCYCFDTYVSITVYKNKDEKYLDDCIRLCEKYDKLFGKNNEGSDIYNINSSNGEEVTVDDETFYLLKRSLEFCEETDGAVDITVAPLTDIWGFNHKGNEISVTKKPEDNEIKKED